MSNSSVFQSDNQNYNYTQPFLHFSSMENDLLKKEEIINKKISNISSSLSSKGIENPLNNVNKYEIEIYATIKKSESNLTKELIKIIMYQYLNKKPRLIIQIINKNDFLFLYTLELSELEYQQFKSEQNLLVNFENFPTFIFKMLNLYKNDRENKYSCILNISNAEGNNNNLLKALGTLTIEEKTEFRKLNHLMLKLQSANDDTLKIHLKNFTKEYKDNYDTLLEKYNEIKKNYDIIQMENNNLKDNYQKLELKYKACIDKVNNEKFKEINFKENNSKEIKKQLEILEIEKNKIITGLENKISKLENELIDKIKNLNQLNENKKELEKKKDQLNIELNVYKSEINNLQKENSELNQKNVNNEKNLIELNFKNQNLSKELEDKNKSLENSIKLNESLNKQKDSNEDIIKSLKANNNKLEIKITLSINEINKANDIIEKLQNEVKNQKTKINSMKNEINMKEQIISEKQVLLNEQNIILNNIRKDNENKNKKIISLNNKINNYNNKLNENEKLIEENNQMILYLNRNINENINNPFRSRVNYSSTNLINNNLNNNYLGNQNEITYNANLSSKIIDKKIPREVSPVKIQSKIDNDNINNNLNINNTNNSKKNIRYYKEDDQFNQQSNSSYRNNNNNFNSLLNRNSSDMAIPETNYAAYQFKDKISNTLNKNTTNQMRLGFTNSGSLLMHKYGNDKKSKSMYNKNNRMDNNFIKSHSNYYVNNNKKKE